MGKKFTLFRQEIFVLFFFLGFIILSGTIFAGEIIVNNGTTEFRIIAKSYQVLSFSTTLSSIRFRDIETDSGLFSELFITAYGYNNKAGDPKLPAFHKLIETPV